MECKVYDTSLLSNAWKTIMNEDNDNNCDNDNNWDNNNDNNSDNEQYNQKIKNLYRETADSLEDYLNFKKERDSKNTGSIHYNCGGFALKTFSWYKPYDSEHSLDDLFFEEFDGDFDSATDFMVRNMLNDFQNKVREIQDESEAQEDEDIVLFRIGHDEDVGWVDFHYMVKDKKENLYLDKRGGTGWFNKKDKEETYHEDWYGEYNGPIAILAVKNA